MKTNRIITAAKCKEIEAYNSLISEHQDLVYNFAYYILCDETTAIRATQQAFLRAFHNLPGFRGNSVRDWLIKNLIQVLQNKFKGNIRTSAQAERPQVPEIPLATLPMELRLALVLVEIEGLNYQQAAELTGVAPERVARQLSQARQQILNNHQNHLQSG
jgi:RNA polymerase sigma-70 factor, ECF subfamily